MKRHTAIAIAIAITATLATAGCGSSAKSSAGASPPVTTASPPASTTASTPTSTSTSTSASTPANSTATGGAAVQLVDSALGTILADVEGRTLYVFTKDSAGTSACTGGCATAWPPLAGPAAPGAGLDAEDFATIPRDDGTQQVIFYGHPLYTFASDAAPGDVTGQGQNNVWYVVGSDGNAITTAPTSPGY